MLKRTRDWDRVLLNMDNKLQLKLKEGDIAPEFAAETNGGGRISLSDYNGKNVILYFYPPG